MTMAATTMSCSMLQRTALDAAAGLVSEGDACKANLPKLGKMVLWEGAQAIRIEAA